MTCFFIGHRHTPDSLCPRLTEAVERCITEFGVVDFVVGHYGQFDSMAAHAVRHARKHHPEVTLTLLLPYYPYRVVKTPEEYDQTFYPPGMERAPKPFAIVPANQYMMKHSEFLICYNKGYAGNTRDLVELAMRREAKGLITVINLADGS